MGKSKAKKTKRAPAASPFAVGDRVQVVSGGVDDGKGGTVPHEFGHACGTVIAPRISTSGVRLDAEVHLDTFREFKNAELVKLP